MTTLHRRAHGLVAATGFAAALCAATACPAVASAEPAASGPAREVAADSAAKSTADFSAEAMEQRVTQRVRIRLDELAARLEIKASQEPAWQAFVASFRSLLAPGRQDGARGGRPADLDAAALARDNAERAAQHAQLLGRVAEATAKLQSVLSEDQRQVLNEAARRFARGHSAYPAMAHDGLPRRDGMHCRGEDDRTRSWEPHGPAEQGGMPGEMRRDRGLGDSVPNGG